MNDLNPIDAGQGEITTSAPGVDTPTPAPEATPAPSPSQSLTPEQLYEVKIGGQVRKVPLNELLSGYSRTQDYTQKTMALAEERRQLQTQWEQERTQYKEFLSNPDNVQQLYNYLLKQQQAQPQPGQPLTTEQFQAAIAQERAMRQQELTQWQQQQELKTMEDSYRTDIGKHINSILDQHPELKSIRGIDRVLKSAAAEGQPTTIEDAKALIVQAAAEQSQAIRAHFTEQQKQAAVQKTKATQGIEPPGGAAPLPTPKNFRFLSPEFNADVVAALKQSIDGQ